ncbi:MAG: hypothetical protein ACD_81C00106G0009 [uncultured bacterium]|uniref:Transmembrane protein n=1 Tax=Candidatus Wolfebacteria bacterium GW2011_GWE2_44_13 TaxID=1619017 RepID=A0A0G1JHV0_9BACT|nr:MAG: hypothetical protein ACD_81C00106G0009 [uncultured bacterium]KKT43577.1 MAG: hypothetical protein UW32_C0001G0169 [Candidatus Wolfebacteria bacterium GW2011_GWE2_44_13]
MEGKKVFKTVLILLAFVFSILIGLGIYFLNKADVSSIEGISAEEVQSLNMEQVIDCGSVVSPETIDCSEKNLKTCSPAKGIITRYSSDVELELIVDGYNKDNLCSYRVTALPFLEVGGMYINCLVPRAEFSQVVQSEGGISNVYCQGTLIDFMNKKEK